MFLPHFYFYQIFLHTQWISFCHWDKGSSLWLPLLFPILNYISNYVWKIQARAEAPITSIHSCYQELYPGKTVKIELLSYICVSMGYYKIFTHNFTIEWVKFQDLFVCFISILILVLPLALSCEPFHLKV